VDKRLPLALFLSFLVLMAWTMLRPRPQQVEPATSPPAAAGLAPAPDAAPAVRELSGAVIEDEEAREETLVFGRRGDPGHYRARFTNRGAALVELRYANAYDHAGLSDEEKADPEHWVALVEPVATPAGPTRSMLLAADRSAAPLVPHKPLEETLWRARVLGEREAPEGIEFTCAPGGGVTFTKRYLFDPTRTRFVLELELENTGVPEHAGACQLVITPAACMPANSGDVWYKGREPQALAVGRSSSGEPEPFLVAPRDQKGKPAGPLKHTGDLLFAGAENKYFAVLIRGLEEQDQETLAGAGWRKLRDEAWARAHPGEEDVAWRQITTDVQLRVWVPEPGKRQVYRYAVYAGPKDPAQLAAASSDFTSLLRKDLGMFQVISRVLLVVMRFFEHLTGNWGVAIILLTISVRTVLFPLNRRSQTTMARYQSKMKRLQPRIEEIKERWKNDLQRQRQEQAKLMQEEGAFPPLGGCLPMFLQLPVFFGLYRALGLAYELRQSPFFGWIEDLSLPDRLVRLDFDTHLPFLGTIGYLNILPLLMVVTWVLQQRSMPKPADEQGARMYKMMMWMPVMMGFFLYNYAAGLSLYVITQSCLSMFEMKVIKKYWPLDDTEKPKQKKKSGFLARLAQAQQQQMKRVQEMQRHDARRRGPQQKHGKARKA
jgi:YidC/Oxa1 family membrane protein insertase